MPFEAVKLDVLKPGYGLGFVPKGPKVVPFLGLPYRILYMNPQKELLWGFWVGLGSCECQDVAEA